VLANFDPLLPRWPCRWFLPSGLRPLFGVIPFAGVQLRGSRSLIGTRDHDGYSQPLVRVQDYLELVERCRYDGTQVRWTPSPSARLYQASDHGSATPTASAARSRTIAEGGRDPLVVV
jgi:hypothetical protein